MREEEGEEEEQMMMMKRKRKWEWEKKTMFPNFVVIVEFVPTVFVLVVVLYHHHILPESLSRPSSLKSDRQ